jgi:hypothetical protein
MCAWANKAMAMPSTITDQLSALGARRVFNIGRGDCLYFAFAQGMGLIQDDGRGRESARVMSEMRRRVADAIRANPDWLARHGAMSDAAVEAYVQRHILREGAWADTTECVLALAMKYPCTLVMMYAGDSESILTTSNGDQFILSWEMLQAWFVTFGPVLADPAAYPEEHVVLIYYNGTACGRRIPGNHFESVRPTSNAESVSATSMETGRAARQEIHEVRSQSGAYICRCCVVCMYV